MNTTATGLPLIEKSYHHRLECHTRWHRLWWYIQNGSFRSAGHRCSTSGNEPIVARANVTRYTFHILLLLLSVLSLLLLYYRYIIPTQYCYDDAFDKQPLIRRSTGWSDRINHGIKTRLMTTKNRIVYKPAPPPLPAAWKSKYRIIQIDAMNELHLTAQCTYYIYAQLQKCRYYLLRQFDDLSLQKLRSSFTVTVTAFALRAPFKLPVSCYYTFG